MPDGAAAGASRPPWVVTLRAAGSRPPLFCPCAGGGDVLDYRDLALALPADQPVYVFGLPPLPDAAAFPSVGQLAALYVRAVQAIQPEGPYYLCGHSFGGLVAYEMAALLARAGAEPRLVALLDTLHPYYRQAMSRAERLRFQAAYLSDRVAKYALSLAAGRPDRALGYAAAFVAVRTKHLYWWAARTVFGRLGHAPPARISSNALLLAAAWHGYELQDHDVPVVLFTALDRPAEFRRDPTLGWRACTSRPFAVHVVPGDHCSLLHPPHVQVLAAHLTSYLNGEACPRTPGRPPV